ncbi:MAG: HAD family hydrolase [Phycisphaerae bacterium]|jgi:D-glycero-D-manno-heptose 1,7-bisphosphate phosphatase|nr:HAD family hydrolase [Phycisphaerae bacterium]
MVHTTNKETLNPADGNKNPAVFLDRDGTIIHDAGYIKTPDLVRFLPLAPEALVLLQNAGYRLIVVSNQSGIARGLISLDQLCAVQNRFFELLQNHNITLTDYLFCPHHPNGAIAEFQKTCTCRKPAPGMLLAAAKKYNIDLANSWMIGDKSDDVRAGQAAGTQTIRLISPLSSPLATHLSVEDSRPDFYAENLFEAAKIIIRQLQESMGQE